MKQGFTLIELVIVMVVVGILVTVALPQYQRSAERGRSLVGLANIRAIADRLNAYYLLNGTYPATQDDFKKLRFDTTNDSLFASPTYNGGTSGQVLLPRNASSGWEYRFESTHIGGETVTIQCQNTSEENVCEKLGLEGNLLQN